MIMGVFLHVSQTQLYMINDDYSVLLLRSKAAEPVCLAAS